MCKMKGQNNQLVFVSDKCIASVQHVHLHNLFQRLCYSKQEFENWCVDNVIVYILYVFCFEVIVL